MLGIVGMVLWPTMPPRSWKLSDYNSEQQVQREPRSDGKFYIKKDANKGIKSEEQNKMLKWAKSSESKKPLVRVPYKANRCIIFDSSLLHATENVKFGHGYSTRRINLTFLFGGIHETCAAASKKKKDIETARSYLETDVKKYS